MTFTKRKILTTGCQGEHHGDQKEQESRPSATVATFEGGSERADDVFQVEETNVVVVVAVAVAAAMRLAPAFFEHKYGVEQRRKVQGQAESVDEVEPAEVVDVVGQKDAGRECQEEDEVDKSHS